MFRAELEALRARIDELESMANDAYDIAAGILDPGITDLAPPAPEQEVFGGGGGASAPVAWTVVNAGGWKVTTPLWVYGPTREKLLETTNITPVGNETLYAKLTVVYNAETLEIIETDTEAEVVLMNDSDTFEAETPVIPPAYDATGDTGTNGSYPIYVKIGKFVTDTSTGTTTFVQYHTGAIILPIPEYIGTFFAGDLYDDWDNSRIVQPWQVTYKYPDSRGTVGKWVKYNSTDFATTLNLINHIDDHADGVITTR